MKEDGATLLAMYGQWDGYLIGGVGETLVRFLAKMRVSHGISDYSEKNVANGGGCLAAQIVVLFKTPEKRKPIGGLKRPSAVGRFYLHPTDCEDEECTYTVRVEDQKIFLHVVSYLPSLGEEDGRKVNVEKTPAQWLAFIHKEKLKIASEKRKQAVS